MNAKSDTPMRDSVEHLVQLAEHCPDQYPLGWDGWKNHPAVRALSEALTPEYPHLAKAVLQGKSWTRLITYAETKMDMERMETDASCED